MSCHAEHTCCHPHMQAGENSLAGGPAGGGREVRRGQQGGGASPAWACASGRTGQSLWCRRRGSRGAPGGCLAPGHAATQTAGAPCAGRGAGTAAGGGGQRAARQGLAGEPLLCQRCRRATSRRATACRSNPRAWRRWWGCPAGSAAPQPAPHPSPPARRAPHQPPPARREAAPACGAPPPLQRRAGAIQKTRVSCMAWQRRALDRRIPSCPASRQQLRERQRRPHRNADSPRPSHLTAAPAAPAAATARRR